MAAPNMNPTLATADLRAVLIALGDEQRTPGEVITALPNHGINRLYAQQLLTGASGRGLVDVHDDYDGTAYSMTDAGREWLAATARLDKPSTGVVELNQTAGKARRTTGHKEPKMTETTTPAVSQVCRCGCEREIGTKSTFAQGHDARMVSQLVALVTGWQGKGKTTAGVAPTTFETTETEYITAGSTDIQEAINVATDYVTRDFGDKLAAKFHDAAMEGWDRVLKVDTTAQAKAAKAEAKAAKAAEKDAAKLAKAQTANEATKNVEGIKVGRWIYPARMVDGQLERNTKRDGSGEWVAA